jgi:hypothetical protein
LLLSIIFVFVYRSIGTVCRSRLHGPSNPRKTTNIGA